MGRDGDQHARSTHCKAGTEPRSHSTQGMSRPRRVPAAPAVPARTPLKQAWPRPARSTTIPAARWLQLSCSAHWALPEAVAHGARQMRCAAWGGVHEGEPVMLVTDGAGPGTLTCGLGKSLDAGNPRKPTLQQGR